MTALAAGSTASVTLDANDVLIVTGGNANYTATPTTGSVFTGYLTGSQRLGPFKQYVTVSLSALTAIDYSSYSETDVSPVVTASTDLTGGITLNAGSASMSLAYDKCAIVPLGDSRLAYQYADPPVYQQRAASNFLNQALSLTNQRFRIVTHTATAGQRSDQYLAAANVSAALATNAYWLLIYGVVNDIAANGASVDYWNAYIKPVVIQWINSGRSVILMTESGSTGLASSGAAYMGAVHKYNAQIQDFCKYNNNAVFFDAAAVVMSPTATMTPVSGYSQDGVHINTIKGAIALGSAFATLLNSLIPASDPLVRSIDQLYANGGVQWLNDPLWQTTTGGTGSGILTGTVPAMVTAVGGPGGTAITGSISAGAYGNLFQMAITTTQAGKVVLALNIASGAIESAGDVFFANCKYDLASGSSNFQGAGLSIESSRNSVVNVSQDGYCRTAEGAAPTTAQSWMAETEKLTVAAGTRNYFVLYAIIFFSAAGSATLTISQTGLWKVQS